ncbi:DUF535 family protein [Limnohabitans sp.]|uniref:DUF535 family protein n=1 Tax=Limnohabitans sp. TaxID=1907725 RepID=UPI00286F148D|nr:DUF535 family protein [Limnohabitans sp.]
MTHRSLDAPTPQELFRLTDNGSGGWLQTAKRRLKFGLRYWWCEAHLRRIHDFFLEHGLAELTRTELPVMLRPMRPYLWGGLSAEARTHAMLAHFEWLMARHSAQVVVDFYKRGAYTFFKQSYPEGDITVELEPGRGLGREGEFELHLKLNGAAVMRAAFSILPSSMVSISAPGFVMAIGNMQGQRFLNQEIKIVTQKMERTRPQNILMTALQGLASGWQLVGMVGVSDVAHVYSGYRSLSQRVGQSYDALWQEMGTTGALSEVHWNLPIQWVARSEQDVPSNKRSQLRRKNEIRQKIFDEVAHNSAGL